MLEILILIFVLIGFFVAFFLGKKITEKEIKLQRKDAILKSRSVLGGIFAENLAPYLPDFPYSPTECKFLGKPIDLIVFKGMDEKNISEIIFLEIKSGNSSLSSQEKNLKNSVENKKVRFEEYRIPKNLTK